LYILLIGGRRLAETQFGKLQIDRTEEIRNWANKMKELKENEKDVKVRIVAANNHYRGYDPEHLIVSFYFLISLFHLLSPVLL